MHVVHIMSIFTFLNVLSFASVNMVCIAASPFSHNFPDLVCHVVHADIDRHLVFPEKRILEGRRITLHFSCTRSGSADWVMLYNLKKNRGFH